MSELEGPPSLDIADDAERNFVWKNWFLNLYNKVNGSTSVEGADVLSTGEVAGTKYLRENGDGTSSWQGIVGGAGGDLLAANNLSDVASAATSRTNLDVDQAGTDNSTDVTVTGEDFLSLTGQAITANPIDLDNLSATGTPSASTYLRGDNSWQAIAGGGDLLAANNLSDVASAATSRTNLDVDQAGTDNSTDVTLAGTGTYLSLIGQAITVDPITESDISDLGSYLTAETNDLSAAVTWANVPDANITQGSVTQHVAAIDHDSLLNFDANEHADITGTVEVTGNWTFNDFGTGGLTDYDIEIGDTDGTPTYGMAHIGNSSIGRTSHNAAGLDLDGSFLIRNTGAPATSNIEFAFAESSNSVRFAIPKSAVGNATYNPRSMLCAGPAPSDDSMVTVAYWQGLGIFDNLVCDTGTYGADLGVQNDLEVEGDIFVDSILESTTAAGVTIDSVLLKDGLVDGIDVAARDHAAVTTSGTGTYIGLTGQDIQIDPIAVTDLADGTDGELITWSAAGVATTVPVGTATHVLTSNGVGVAPTFQAAAGGGGAPTENVILTGTKTSGQNINGVEGTETDLTWDVVAQDTGELTSFTTGDANIIFTNAGWLNIHASAYVANGVVNNRSMWSLGLYHYDSGDALKYSYHGDMQYNRDDAAGYDSSGGSVEQNMMLVAAGDYIYIRMRVFDDGTSGTAQTLDTTYSKLRIAQIVF